jgi:hypothetical protein
MKSNPYLDKLGTSSDRFFLDDLEGFALRTSGASVTKSLTSTSSVQAGKYLFHFQISKLANCQINLCEAEQQPYACYTLLHIQRPPNGDY